MKLCAFALELVRVLVRFLFFFLFWNKGKRQRETSAD